MKNEPSLGEKILNITTGICSNCHTSSYCIEMKCPIYRIENLITKEYPEEEYDLEDENN